MDINLERLVYLEIVFGLRVELLYSSFFFIEVVVVDCDLFVGVILVFGCCFLVLIFKSLVE